MTPDSLLKTVREAIVETTQALDKGVFSEAREGYPTTTDLLDIKGQLERVENELVRSQIPQKNKRQMWIGRIITDGWWQYKEPLKEKLLVISDTYLRKLA